MKKINTSIPVIAVFLLCFVSAVFSCLGQGTAFTYQGRLNFSGAPANGSYDLTFTIYDAPTGNGAFAVQTNAATAISNGLFTVMLDFGPYVFTGADRWLEIAVRTNGSPNYTNLTPRQQITPTPMAIFSATAGSISTTFSLSASNISNGTLSDNRLSSNVALRAGGNAFTNTQTFNGAIDLNSSDGFDQSALGNFLVDAPFLAGGRFAVLENGNVGVGNPSPFFKLDVGGDVNLSGNLYLPLPATIYSGSSIPLLRADAGANFFSGIFAGNLTLTGVYNSGIGYATLYQNTSGSNNTALGALALYSNVNGSENVANGYQALYSNSSGSNNVATGAQALFSTTTGRFNTADGHQALYSNTQGSNNVASGFQALYSNTTGESSVATGFQALFSNRNGLGNVANGFRALYSNTSGNLNTANGFGALYSNTNGTGNVAVGGYALNLNTSGAGNTAIGDQALLQTLTGSRNIGLGNNAGYNITTGNDNIDVGHAGNSADNGVIRIGLQGTQTNTFIAGIFGATVNGSAVVVNSSGQLGVAPSSQRFKENIRSMDDASDALLALHPVTFSYKPEIDPKGMAQFGLIAEEVAKINPALVTRDENGEIYTVRYDAVNAMLLNEFLKEHHEVEAQRQKLEELREKLVQQVRVSDARITALEQSLAELKRLTSRR